MTSANTASVGAMVRRSTPNTRSSAGTQPASGSNLGAETGEDLSVSGSGIPAQPFYRCGRRLSSVGVESNDREEARGVGDVGSHTAAGRSRRYGTSLQRGEERGRKNE